jgi:hypothetical protein
VSETTLSELLDAVSKHLKDEIAPALDGFMAFEARVAANSLAMIQRELASRPQLDAVERRLTDYLRAHMATEDAEVVADTDTVSRNLNDSPQEHSTSASLLAVGLRDGTIAAHEPLIHLLRERTMLRIAVDNPRYSGLAEARRRWSNSE